MSESCRICLKDDSTGDPLLQVCNCARDQMVVHKSCAEEWLQFTSQTHCPYCGFKIIVKYYPKTWFTYLWETPEDLDEIKELFLRMVNVGHMIALSYVIWKYNPFGCFSTKTIGFITGLRAFFICRLCFLFGQRTRYSLKEWQKTHLKVVVFPNPNPKTNSGTETNTLNHKQNT